MTNLAHRFLISVTLAYAAMLVALVALITAFSGMTTPVKGLLLFRGSTSEGGGTPSGDALLMESGDYLLLESGDFLLLE